MTRYRRALMLSASAKVLAYLLMPTYQVRMLQRRRR